VGAIVGPASLNGFLLPIIALHIRSVKRKGFELTAENLRARHIRHLLLPLSYETAFDNCVAAVKSLRKSEVTAVESSMGKIEAKIGGSWESWGDRITISVVSKSEDNQISVTISSEPTSQILDYGRNLQHVEAITDFLNKKLPA